MHQHVSTFDIRSERRLLLRSPCFAQKQKPWQQSVIRQQLAYWRTLGKQKFTQLTSLDMSLDVKPVYHSKITILAYLLRQFPAAAFIALCKQVHPTSGAEHYHVLIQFPIGQYHILNAQKGGNLYFNPQLFPHYCVNPVYSNQAALAYIHKDDPQPLEWTVGDQIPQYKLCQIPQQLEQIEKPLQSSTVSLNSSSPLLVRLLQAYQHSDFSQFVSVIEDIHVRQGVEFPLFHSCTSALAVYQSKKEAKNV